MIRGTGAVTTTSARAGWRHSFFKQKTAYDICDKYPAFALMTDRQDRKAFFRELGKYSALGLEMALSVVIGMGIGYYLDRWLGAGGGAAIACGNFFLIRKILEKAFSGGGAVSKAFVVQYALKFLGLIGVVYLVVRYGGFDVLGFLLGLSSPFLGVLLEALARSSGAKA